jgi:hypothetical protein
VFTPTSLAMMEIYALLISVNLQLDALILQSNISRIKENSFKIRDCSKELTVGACSVASCDSSRGCYLEPIPSLTLDCGLCALSGETCADQGLGAGDIAGISAGVVAGIVIAIVAVLAVAGGFGGKKLYDVYLKNKGMILLRKKKTNMK